MPRGSKLQVRDLLIIWNAVARGVRSPTQIRQLFDEMDERDISTDSIRRVIGDYDEVVRLLPEFPNLRRTLQGKEITTERLREHWDDLAETARKLSLNLERYSPSEIYPEYIAYDRRDTEELENVDDYLGRCLLSHLKAEFPELFNMDIWQKIYDHGNKREVYEKLALVAHRRIFKGKCNICRDW